MEFSKRVGTLDGKLVHKLGDETMWIEPWGQDGLRVRITTGPEVSDTAWALTEPLSGSASNAEVVFELTDTMASIRNGSVSAQIHDTYTQPGHLQFFKHSGDAKECILSEHDYVVHAHNPGTRIFRPSADQLCHSEIHFASHDGERFYGMGLNSTGRVNLKGCVIDLYQRHVKHVVPFLVSSRGYGFLWNNPSLGRLELGNNMTRWVSYGCRQVDYFITVGDSYAQILEHYADATGHAPELPYWASGLWQCKLRYETQDEFLGVAREFKRLGIPLSVLVIDFMHWKHHGDWKLDPTFWPDPAAMVRELDDMGVRIMISPWTLVNEQSENYAQMKAQGLFTGSLDGNHDTVNCEGQRYQYDPTNPAAAKFLWGKWKENYFDLGIRTFWLDPCDDFHEIKDYDQVTYHIGPAKEAHAYFPIAHQKNIFEGLHNAGETEVVTICRNSWAGSQRYGAAPAAHDIMSSFEHLTEYMKAGLNLAMSGIPWGASEIGGFITFDNESDKFHELMVRWYQYGVFTPIFRTHGCRKNNEPWTIGGDAYRHIRASIFLRERLRPYVMAQMKVAANTGTPPMRPVFYDFTTDSRAADIEDQFLFGPDLLIAPILAYQERRRQVYLPEGTEWTDAWSGESLDGGQTVAADAPIERIPVFIRGKGNGLLAIFDGLYDL